MDADIVTSGGAKKRRKLRTFGLVAVVYVVLWIVTAAIGCPQIKKALRPPQPPSPRKVTMSSSDIVATADYNNNVGMQFVTTASPAPFLVIATFHDVMIHADLVSGSTSRSSQCRQWCWWLFGLRGRF